ncbi:MAG: hypothetical protein V7L11_00400 [Nostoc sp.]|uniref:hypothetical protein n=1 Tax=Nostoc sp. TaxID=1180 RepID=UPI002FF70138
MESLILEFCEFIANKDNPQSENKTIISQEIERAIRNITELKIINKTIYDGERRNNLRTDLAKELFEVSKEELKEELRLESLKNTALNNQGQRVSNPIDKRTCLSSNQVGNKVAQSELG